MKALFSMKRLEQIKGDFQNALASLEEAVSFVQTANGIANIAMRMKLQRVRRHDR